MNPMTVENYLGKEIAILKMLDIKPNYAQLADLYGIDWRTVKSIYLNGPADGNHRNKHSNIEEYDDIIREKMQLKGIKVSALYNFLKEEKGFNCSYSSLTWYLRKHNIKKPSKENGKVLYETGPGEQLQFDWVEDITMILRGGNEVTFNVFSAELSYSRMHCFIYSETKTKEDVIMCLVKSFEYFSGTPEGLLTDNMSSIVHDGKFCSEMKAFANDFNIKLNRCKVKHCWTKGKVETRNKFMKWLIPYNGEVDSIDDIINIIKKINITVNDNINERINTKPILAYQKEKKYLNPIPSKEIRNHYFDLKVAVKVSNVSTIHYKGKQYSVPEKFINKTLKVKEINNKLYIYNNTDLICTHDITDQQINYREEDYVERLKRTMSNSSDEDIEALAKKNLMLFEKLKELGDDINGISSNK